MLSETELSRAAKIAEECLNKVRAGLQSIEIDHDTGLMNDPEGHEKFESEAKRLRGIYYSLEALVGSDSKMWVNKVINDAYSDMMRTQDRVFKTDIDDPRFDEYMVEANVRSNVFFALAAAREGNYCKVLDEINRSFLN